MVGVFPAGRLSRRRICSTSAPDSRVLVFVGEAGGTTQGADPSLPISAAGNRASRRRGFAQFRRRQTRQGRGDLVCGQRTWTSRSGRTAPASIPQAVFAHSYVDAKVMAEALVRIGDYVAEHGVRGEGHIRRRATCC